MNQAPEGSINIFERTSEYRLILTEFASFVESALQTQTYDEERYEIISGQVQNLIEEMKTNPFIYRLIHHDAGNCLSAISGFLPFMTTREVHQKKVLVNFMRFWFTLSTALDLMDEYNQEPNKDKASRKTPSEIISDPHFIHAVLTRFFNSSHFDMENSEVTVSDGVKTIVYRDKDSSVTFIIESGISTECNSNYLTSILMRLASNAHGHGVKGIDGEKKFVVKISKGSINLKIEVGNNGVAMPDYDEDIWNKDYDEMNKTTHSGLGLFTVNLLIDKMGGRVKRTSNVEGDVRFLLKIPLKENSLGPIRNDTHLAIDGAIR